MEKVAMKFCFAIEEILRREVVVDAISLEAGFNTVKRAYNNEQIVLDYKDIVLNASGASAKIYEADGYEAQDVQDMDLTEF